MYCCCTCIMLRLVRIATINRNVRTVAAYTGRLNRSIHLRPGRCYDMICTCTKMHLVCTLASVPPMTEGLFSRSLRRGTQGGAVHCTLHASLDPGRAPWRALWAFRVTASCLFSCYRFSPSQSQAGPWRPQTAFFSYLHLFCGCF